MSDVKDQIAQAATELRKLIDRIEQEAIEAIESPTMERVAAFDAHKHLIEKTLTVLRRTLLRRAEREQSQTEPDQAEDEDEDEVDTVEAKKITHALKTIRPPK